MGFVRRITIFFYSIFGLETGLPVCSVAVNTRVGKYDIMVTLRWRHNGHDSVSNLQPYDCLLNRLFRRRWKKTSKLRVTGLCVGNSPGTGEFPAQMASNAENVSIWWRHHVKLWVVSHRILRLEWSESEAEMSSFWRNFRHWLHRKLSKS